MATFNDLELEQLAEADKHVQRKASTLGADGSVIEEPFGLRQIILREDIFSETPTAETDFAGPDYGDAPSSGAVATRYVHVRLHPLVTSGKDGNSSIQSFVAIRANPISDSPEDIEAVRIKHLVPSDLSPGRRTADEPDLSFRGFELALYPAQDTAGTLTADVSRGPIPISADPGDAYGIGDEGRWTVDYANGIVRFSRAPLNGPNGVMNPNNIFGNKDGYTTAIESGGRITMFATFYQYVGPTLIDPDDVGMVTVGDGYQSFGTFYGRTSAIMQKAVDSLQPNGGTVFVKEGDYSYYTNSVSVPENVNIIGLSKNARIVKPLNGPAFQIFGSHVTVRGLTIIPYKCMFGGVDSESGSGIEIITTDETSTSEGFRTVEDVTIKDNILLATADAYGVGFSPRHLNSQFNNVKIEDNIFRSCFNDEPSYIAERIDGGSVTLNNITITGNDFGKVMAKALHINGTCVEDINDLRITDNYSAGKVDILVDTGVPSSGVYIANNSEFENIKLNELSAATIEHNICSNVVLDGYVSDSQVKDNLLYTFEIAHTASSFMFSGNTCMGDVIFRGNQANTDGLLNVIISNNKLHQFLRIADGLTSAGSYQIDNLIIEDNRIDTEIVLSSDDIGTNVTYSNLQVRGNTIGDDRRRNILSIGSNGASQNIYLNQAIFEGNTLYGDVSVYDNVQVRSTGGGLRFVDNTFDVNDRGLYLYGHVLNHLDISSNRLAHIVLYRGNFTLSSDETSAYVYIRNNVITNNGSIVLEPNIDASGAVNFVISNLHIIGNIFEAIGEICILKTEDVLKNYDMIDVFVEKNTIPSGHLYVGFEDLGSSANITNLSLKENYVDGVLFVGGGDISQFEAIDNKVTGPFVVQNKIDGLVCRGNYANLIEFRKDLTVGTITDNRVTAGGGFVFGGKTIDINVNSNNIDGYFTLSERMDGSAFVGNRISGLFTANLAMADSSLTGNIFEGRINLIGPVDNTIFSDNDAYGSSPSLNFESFVRNSTITDNRIVSNVVISGGFISSMFENNKTSGSLTFSSNITNSKISGNSGTGASSSLTIAGRPYNIEINDNTFNSIVTINNSGDGAKERVMISNNIFAEAVTISGDYMLNSSVIGNTFRSTFESSSTDTNAWDGVVFSNNSIVSTATFDRITSSTIGTNNFYSTVTFGDAISKTSFVNNSIIGGTPSISFVNWIENFVFTGNQINFGIVFGDAIDDSTFGDNQISGDMTFARAIANSVISGNRFDGSFTMGTLSSLTDVVFNGNIIGSTCWLGELERVSVESNTFSDDLTFSKPLKYTVLSGNIINGTTIPLRFLDTIENVVFADSYVAAVSGYSLSCAGSITKSTMSGNTIDGAAVFNDTDQSAFFGNTIGGTLSFSIANDLQISGNSVNDDALFAGAVARASLIGNNFRGNNIALNFLDRTTDVVVADGYAASMHFAGAAERTSITGNTLVGDITFDSSATSCVVSNNTSTDGGIAFDSAISCVVSGNIGANGGIAAVGQVEDLAISDNIVASLLLSDATTPKARLVMSGNNFSGAVSIAGPNIADGSGMVESNISNNRINGNLLLEIPIENTIISDNVIGSLGSETKLGSATYKSLLVSFSGNEAYSAVSFYKLEKCAINANTFNASLSFDNISYVTITGNNSSENCYCTIDGVIDNTTISENIIGYYCLIRGAVTNSIISNNHIFGTDSNSAFKLSDGSAEKSVTIVGNIFEHRSGATYDAFVVSASGLKNSTVVGNSFFGKATISYMRATNFSNNYSTGVVKVESVAGGSLTNGSVMSDNIFDGNLEFDGYIKSSSVDGNSVVGTLAVAGIFEMSVLSNNSVSVCTVTTVSDSIISGNLISSTFTSSTSVADTTISSNKFIGNVNFNSSGLVRSTFDANVVDGKLTVTIVNNAIISNNTLSAPSVALEVVASMNGASFVGNNTDGEVILPNIQDTTIGGNTVGGVINFGGTILDSSITGNDFKNDISLPNTTVTNSVFATNHVNGNMSNVVGTYTYTGFNMSNNTIDGNIWSRNAWDDCSIVGNIILGLFSIDTGEESNFSVKDSVISSNKIGDSFYLSYTGAGAASGALYESLFADNVIDGYTTFETTQGTGDSASFSANIKGNIFGGYVQFKGVDTEHALLKNCVVSGNIFRNDFYIYHNATTSGAGPFENLAFTNNYCSGLVLIKTGFDGNNTFDNGSFVGNIFATGITFGDSVSTKANKYTRIAIQGNSGTGSVRFYTTGAVNMPGCLISGNTMSGVFDIIGAGVGAYTSPPSGANQAIWALNDFGSYGTGLAVDNTKSLGWGTGDGTLTVPSHSAGAADPGATFTVTGSNK